MALHLRKKSAYKREKRKDRGRGRRTAAKVFRLIVILLGVVLLVLPILLLADPISYAPLLMLVIALLLSWLYLRVLKRSVRVELAQAEYSCLRGETAGLSVRLVNTSVLPVVRLELRFVITDLFGGADDERTLVCSLAPRETTNVEFDAQFPHLGSYQAGIREVVIYDLLGIFTTKRADGVLNSVVVDPAKVDLGGTMATQAMPDESNRMLKPIASDNEDYASVRDYHRGDPLKTVHWNLSSRNPDGKLYTRLFEEYVNPSLVIIIDSLAPDYEGETLMSLFDGIVECAAALSEQARATGVDAEIRYFNQSNDQEAAFLTNDDEVNMLVERLHRIVPADQIEDEAVNVADMIEVAGSVNRGFGNVALVTSRADDDCLAALMSIRARRRNAMAFVAVPREMDDRAREKFLAPVVALSESGVPYYVVESTPLGTEVHGL